MKGHHQYDKRYGNQHGTFVRCTRCQHRWRWHNLDQKWHWMPDQPGRCRHGKHLLGAIYGNQYGTFRKCDRCGLRWKKGVDGVDDAAST